MYLHSMATTQRLTTLYRPTGQKGTDPGQWLEAISAASARPADLYPVLNEAYVAQIAGEWNTKDGGTGYVMRFHVDASFLNKYEVQTVGSSIHQEYWVPAAELADFNCHIVGAIEVVAVFGASEREQES